MKKLIITLAVLVLSGCATTLDLRSTKPTETGVSAKSANKFASCVSEGWRGTGYRITSTPRDNGISLQLPNGGGMEYDFVLDIDETSTGSEYKFYERWSAFGNQKINEAVRNCK
ncbi:hypothetical protein DVP82_18650 [Yersinia enterocolitica]|nr:hypothetical protein [Yersinia enterocolitica]EKN5942961.1 hypothetical protein [Yersinia enterocolitica]